MKPIALAAILFAALPIAAIAQTADDLKKDGNGGTTDNILTYGMGYHQNRYSPLKQVNRETVKRLVPVWNLSLDNNWGEQAQPIVYNGVMYVTNARATVAIDVGTGKQIWKQTLDWPPETPRVVCCGVSNKGAAIYDGKVYRTTLDAHVIAYDAKTGKEVWKTKVADWKDGVSLTLAPLIANGVMVVGNSGAEFGVRGFIDGYDPATGKQLWRKYTIPARGEKGNETWPQNSNAWEVGGGSTWITGSYDPELDLMYWGTGNPAPWATQSRPGDNLYTSSVLAMRPKTGEIVWHYQFTPNDAYDYDANWELINAEINVGGQKRKVIMQFNRNGFLYVIDRTQRPARRGQSVREGELGDARRQGDRPAGRDRTRQEAARRSNAGRAVADAARRQELAARGLQPGDRAALRQHPAPGRACTSTSRPSRTSSASATCTSRTCRSRSNGGEPWGHIDAIDPLTGKQKWRVPLTDHSIWSAKLVTGGGLLFTGKETGEFIALDIDNGKQVWQFQTGSGINAQPVTFTHNGKQYVTVLSGVGGLYWNVARDKLKDTVPQGGSVWTFALID